MSEQFHDRVEFLTGEVGCPYPSPRFEAAIMSLPDELAKLLIAERRTFYFPDFIMCEPQDAVLSELGF